MKMHFLAWRERITGKVAGKALFQTHAPGTVPEGTLPTEHRRMLLVPPSALREQRTNDSQDMKSAADNASSFVSLTLLYRFDPAHTTGRSPVRECGSCKTRPYSRFTSSPATEASFSHHPLYQIAAAVAAAAAAPVGLVVAKKRMLDSKR